MSKATQSFPISYMTSPGVYADISNVSFQIEVEYDIDAEAKQSTVTSWSAYIATDANGTFTNKSNNDPNGWYAFQLYRGSSSLFPYTSYSDTPIVLSNNQRYLLASDNTSIVLPFTKNYVGVLEDLRASFDISYINAFNDRARTYTGSLYFKLERRTPETTVLNFNNFNDEQNPYFSYSLGYTDNVTAAAKLSVGDWEITRTLDSLSPSGSYTFQLTDLERTGLRNELDYVTSGTAIVTLTTTTSVGIATSSGSAIVTIINANPTISGTYTIDGGATSIIPGNNKVNVSCNVTFKKGATAGSYKITCGNKSINTATGTFNNLDVNKIVFSVIDSRGNTASQTVTITEMVDYVPLTCVVESTNPIEDDDGNITSTFNISGAYYNGSFGSTPNTLTLKYRKTINSTVGDWENISTAGIITGNRYSTSVSIVTSKTAAFSIEVQATDYVKTVSANSTKISVTPVFDWSDTDFNFNVPIYLNGKLIPLISESGTFSSGSNTFYYRKWNDGISEAWGHISGSVSISSTANFGNLYSSDEIPESNITFPEGLFIGRPDVIAQLESRGTVAFLVTSLTSASATQSGSYQIVQSSYSSYPSYTICYQIRGRWKV